MRFEQGLVEGDGIDATSEIGKVLVAVSRYSGKWHVTDTPSIKGTAELIFTTNSHGAVEGRIENGTGAKNSFDGPVTGMNLEGETIFFVVSSEASCEEVQCMQ